jgi:hypothetical protein
VTSMTAIQTHRRHPFTRWTAVDSVAPDKLSCGPRQPDCGCWRLENFLCSFAIIIMLPYETIIFSQLGLPCVLFNGKLCLFLRSEFLLSINMISCSLYNIFYYYYY